MRLHSYTVAQKLLPFMGNMMIKLVRLVKHRIVLGPTRFSDKANPVYNSFVHTFFGHFLHIIVYVHTYVYIYIYTYINIGTCKATVGSFGLLQEIANTSMAGAIGLLMGKFRWETDGPR